MSSKKCVQAKDITEDPVLRFVAGHSTSTWQPGFDNSVLNAMPAGTPPKVALAKMRALIKRGLVDGCGCGCMGGFTLTDAGRQRIEVTP